MRLPRCCQILFAGVALGALPLLTDCKRKVEPPPPHVVQAIDRLLQDRLSGYADDPGIAALISAYSKSGDPALATAEGTTMLHLACTAGSRPLIQHLLEQGADPNAESSVFSLPIVCLFDNPRDNEGETAHMVKLLLSHGAKIEDYSVFQFAEHLHADAYLELLKQSWHGECGRQAGVVPAKNGWADVLRYVLENAGSPLPDEYKALLHEVAAGDSYLASNGEYLACAQMLLDKGASVEQGDANGTTPIMTAAKAAYADTDWHNQPGDTLQLLLQHDANVYRTFENDPDYPGYCAYDLLMGNKQLMNNLTASGYRFDAPPPLDFSEGEALIHAVLRADLRSEPQESLRASFGQIATLLSPNDSLKNALDYYEALCSAINLLMRADTVQGTTAIAAMPLWRDESFWLSDSEVPLTILETLHRNEVSVSPQVLLPLAQKADAAGRTFVAAELMELLAFSTAEDEVIERFTHDSRLALQAGAWQALLLRKGLPAAKKGSVENWLWGHGNKTADSPDMKRALRLTSHDRIWSGRMAPREREELFRDIEAIGEPETAAWYRRVANELDAVGVEEADTTDAEDHLFRLECATARFLLQHAALFAEKQENDGTGKVEGH